MFRLSPETPADEHEVEYLYDLSFAPGRQALSSYRLREGVSRVSELSLVARDGLDGVAGAIRYWPVLIGAAGHSALLLGPIAVHPTHQGEGLGASLIWESLARAHSAGWARVLLVGDAPYYRRFGFSKLENVKFPPPTNPERLLGKALVEGGFNEVSGLVRSGLGPMAGK
jgi:predicted N-acetyltransferase YhbS